jgi:hypothetical protein
MLFESTPEIIYIQVPPDSRSFVLLGYKDGALEIRDTKTLSKVLFTHNFS